MAKEVEMNLYLFSGLGADERAFAYLRLPGNIHHVAWIPPEKNESLKSYTKRLLVQLEIKSPCCLMGLSFGGLVATEASQLIPEAKVVLLSTIKHSKEKPWIFDFFYALRIHRLAFQPPLPLAHFFFGAKTAKEKKALNEFILRLEPSFLKWALGEIFRWKNTYRPQQLLHLHGDKDLLFPIGPIDCEVIHGGGHLMVMKQANEISKRIASFLKD